MKPRHEAGQDPDTGMVQFAISDGVHTLAGTVSSQDEYRALVTVFAGWHREAEFPPRTVPSWVQEPAS